MRRVHVRDGLVAKLAASVLVIGLAATAAVSGTFSSLSGSTTNASNYLTTGSVSVGDNSGGSAMYQDSSVSPGSTVQRCIQVTYTGSAAADMNLYLPDKLDTLAKYTDLTIDEFEGTKSGFSSCDNLWGSSQNFYSGNLADFQANYNSYDTGQAVNPGPWYGQNTWNRNSTVVFRFTLTINKDPNAQGLTTGPHSWVWEAHDQGPSLKKG